MSIAPEKNGNGFLAQLTETKERAAAWIFRVLSALIMILVSVVGYFVTTTMSELKGKIDADTKAIWASYAEINRTQSNLTVSLTQLTTTVNDAIREQSAWQAFEQRELQDHEMRLRTLERPANH